MSPESAIANLPRFTEAFALSTLSCVHPVFFASNGRLVDNVTDVCHLSKA